MVKEVLEVRVKRQIGRSNPRVIKTLGRKYSVMSKAVRVPGMFGFKATTIPRVPLVTQTKALYA